MSVLDWPARVQRNHKGGRHLREQDETSSIHLPRRCACDNPPPLGATGFGPCRPIVRSGSQTNYGRDGARSSGSDVDHVVRDTAPVPTRWTEAGEAARISASFIAGEFRRAK